MRQILPSLLACKKMLLTGLVGSIGWLSPSLGFTDDRHVPKYKPSGRSPEALNILSNAYGGSRSAPDALQIADRVPDFLLPKAGGGQVSLKTLRTAGPVVLIFYRGHW